MYSALMGKLNARRKGLLEENEKGFTLIELLVVVIIIGILAAIAIPVYLGVQNNAKDSGAQSDLTNLKTAVLTVNANSSSNSTFPATADFTSSDYTKAGATMSSLKTPTSGSAATYTVNTDKTAFCIQGTSNSGANWGITDSAGARKGTCAAGVFTATP